MQTNGEKSGAILYFPKWLMKAYSPNDLCGRDFLRLDYIIFFLLPPLKLGRLLFPWLDHMHAEQQDVLVSLKTTVLNEGNR